MVFFLRLLDRLGKGLVVGLNLLELSVRKDQLVG